MALALLHQPFYLGLIPVGLCTNSVVFQSRQLRGMGGVLELLCEDENFKAFITEALQDATLARAAPVLRVANLALSLPLRRPCRVGHAPFPRNPRGPWPPRSS